MEKQELRRANSILDELPASEKRRVAVRIADALTIGAKQYEVAIEASFAEEPSNACPFVDECAQSQRAV